MPQKPHWVSGAKFDEVSTVDLPANQFGDIVLAKRATPEESTVGHYFDADGEPVDITTLGVGEWFQDEGGNAFQWADDQGTVLGADGRQYEVSVVEPGSAADQADQDDYEGEYYDGAEQRELVGVGKSAFFAPPRQSGPDLFATINKALQSAVSDEAARTEIAKALAAQQSELSKAQSQAAEAMKIAKAAQEREEVREFISKAAEYDVPVAPEVLGPVLMRMHKALSYEDCAVVAGLLEATGDIFKQYGLDGEFGASDDPFEEVEKYANDHGAEVLEALGKRLAPGEQARLSKEQATVGFLNTNPREYANYKRNRRG